MEEFVPEGSRGVAGKAHSASFSTDRSVESFHPSIVGGGVRGSNLVIDTETLAPIMHGFGH